jgi:predicted DNA-binding transcriptional regulator AlpA
MQLDDDELLHLSAVCEFFGGTRPLNPSTVYRNIKLGIFPPAVKPGPGSSRWLRSECEAARARLIAKRDGAAA